MQAGAGAPVVVVVGHAVAENAGFAGSTVGYASLLAVFCATWA